MARIVGIILCSFLLNSWKCASQLRLTQITDTSGYKNKFQGLPQNFYSQHLGFFCRKELMIQKAISLPVYFRLGSKNYVDYLEKKGNQPIKGIGGY